jgi:hypothetical protein
MRMQSRVRYRIGAGVLACVAAGCDGGGPAEGTLQQPPAAAPPILNKQAVEALKDPAQTKALLQDAPRTKMEGAGAETGGASEATKGDGEAPKGKEGEGG